MKITRLTNIVRVFILGVAIILLVTSSPPNLSVVASQSPQQPPQLTQGKGASLNWSGYMMTDGTFTGAKGTWTVPTVDERSGFGVDATWVGIGGVGSRDLIQAGTQAAVSPNGQVNYEAFFEILPDFSRPLNININGGDSVTVSLNKQTDNQWLITLKNNTSGESTQIKENYNSSLSSAEWIEEAPSGGRRILPLDNFGTVQFSDASAIKDGQTVNLSEAQAQPIIMADFSGQILASVSNLGSDGASFSVERTDNQPRFAFD